MIGYARLAAIPVYLVLAFESGDGRSFWPAAIFLAISLGDYVDGFVARATGQYSRMGALLDPVVDRLTVLSGAAVCWHFELLPRWALAALAAREVVTLVLAQIALRKGIDLEINWLGRIGVALVLASIFWAQVAESFAFDVMLVVGVVFSSAATLVYVRSGQSRRTPPAQPA
jgi:phosphatidylglycerophosphate synthase